MKKLKKLVVDAFNALVELKRLEIEAISSRYH